MVRMAVAAALVIGHHNLRLLLAHYLKDLLNGFLKIALEEGGGIVVVSSASHARVAVPEFDQSRDIENAHGVGELLIADFYEGLGSGQARVTDFAHRAVG